MTTDTLPTLTAFDWVPDFAKGLVRDLRVRWAMEEVGQPYDVELFGPANPRPEGYVARQPFEQVPAFDDGQVQLFETGAILLYVAEQHPQLLPSGKRDKWAATCWLFAALNSVEPSISRLQTYILFNADKDWAKDARPSAEAMVRQKLKRVAHALAGNEWLAGSFSIADILMVTVLENLRTTDLVAEQPVLVDYAARAKARPAYKRALAAQLDDFTGTPPAR
jgi:glutathione S-transferase